MTATTTGPAYTLPIRWVSVCACCLRCGVDLPIPADAEPVTCKTCGMPCSCPGCQAEEGEA